MKLLCVMNGPILGETGGRERRVNRHTAQFLLDLADGPHEIRVASSLVAPDEGSNLSDYDLGQHPAVETTSTPWSLATPFARLTAYFRALPWVLRETRRADALYLFLPSHLALLFAGAAALLGRPYGVYLRGELGLGSAPMRRALGRARFLLATTSLLAERAEVPHVPSDAVTPMIDLTPEDLAADTDVSREPPWKLLFVGRVDEHKGVPEMLDALGRLRAEGVPFSLELAGAAPDLETTRTEAAARGLGDAVFHGMISDPSALAERFRACDLLVLPTHHEGFPRVLYEAMTHGLPIATTFVGGIPSIMRDGENCVELPVRDAEGLADVVRRILADADARQRLADGGIATMRTLLDPSRPSHAQQVEARIARHVG